MSLKDELQTWSAALRAYDAQEYGEALVLFACTFRSSMILVNMGLIYATMGDHIGAVRLYTEATTKDPYHAVGHFQRGVSNFLLERYEVAHRDFGMALFCLRGHREIDYEQLGLKFRLFSAEVRFNRGLCLIRRGRIAKGLATMAKARRYRAIKEHRVIDDVMRAEGEGYTVFSVVRRMCYTL
ncbi:hypothetical protein B0H10DRAFT_2066238 [Mycena sp. CBHHK59/15]|nr:hypothetical protein B0H10DRAFT_2066238 [Mycena sp. CBHHK59/15]